MLEASHPVVLYTEAERTPRRQLFAWQKVRSRFSQNCEAMPRFGNCGEIVFFGRAVRAKP